MKCPKCGYNSFEYLDQCKKCNGDLVSFKTNNGIRAVILPLRPMDQDFSPGEQSSPYAMDQGTEGDDGVFSWSDPAESSAADGVPSFELDLPVPPSDSDPFSFDLDLAQEGAREETAPTMSEFSLDDLGGSAPELAPMEISLDTPAEENQAPSPAASLGEFSFDELYQDEQAPEAPSQPPAFDMNEASAFELEPSPSAGGELSFDDLEPPSLFAAEGECSEEQPEKGIELQNGDAGDGEADETLGLSAEEYESLFGEPPAKNKARG